MAVRWALVWLGIAAASAPAAADRYEASFTVRPTGALARIDDDGVAAPAVVAGGGGAVALSYGLRNWLDLGGELAAIATTRARYDSAIVEVGGSPTTGTLTRTTRVVQARVGATLRLGVAWVPTLHLAVGVGGRQRTAPTLEVSGDTVAPDDPGPGFVLDLLATIRIGLDHRLTRRWTIGVAAGATEGLGINAPSLQLVEADLHLVYTWYPLW